MEKNENLTFKHGMFAPPRSSAKNTSTHVALRVGGGGGGRGEQLAAITVLQQLQARSETEGPLLVVSN